MSNIVHPWEFVIFTNVLVTTHVFQSAFLVVSGVKHVGLISYILDQTVDTVSHSLIFQGHRVTIKR